jgi:hypothetical protein
MEKRSKTEDKAKKTKQKTERTAEQAQQKASSVADKAKNQAHSQAATQKERATENLTDMAHALRQTSDNLRKQDQDTFGRYANQAADQVERFAGHLRERSPEELLHEAQEYARREPALFLGGAFALGVLGARFLKSSSPGSSPDRHYARDGATGNDTRSRDFDSTSSIPAGRDSESESRKTTGKIR